MITELSTANFDTEVLNSSKPVLVDFWSTWCGNCKMISPVIDKIAKEMEASVKVCKMQVMSHTDPLVVRYKVTTLPTLLFIKDGEVKDTIVGFASKDNIVGRLKALL